MPHRRTLNFSLFLVVPVVVVDIFHFSLQPKVRPAGLPGRFSSFHFHAASCAVVSGFMPASVYLCIVFAISNRCRFEGLRGVVGPGLIEPTNWRIVPVSVSIAAAFVSKFRLKLFLSCKSLRACNFPCLPKLYQIFHLWLKI